MKPLIQIGLGVVGLIAVTLAAMWVFRFGLFATGPSPAAKMIPKVQATVAKVQTQEVKAVAKEEVKTQSAATVIEKRTAASVTKIRQSTGRPVYADVPDAEFYRGVCASKLYVGTADCDGYGGKP